MGLTRSGSFRVVPDFSTSQKNPDFIHNKMANRTVKDASSIKGTNPQYLIEKIIRTRIYESKYWKEECFALSGNLTISIVLCAHLLNKKSPLIG